MQIVNTREQINCGTIYYESKRTKNFEKKWIEKFKNDIRDKSETIGVLVTEAMPSDMDRMGLKDGIWICTYNEFKGLSAVLRQTIIKWASVKISQENRRDKMSLLYDFLTSNEFRLQMEGIVEGFSQMQLDLAKERSAPLTKPFLFIFSSFVDLPNAMSVSEITEKLGCDTPLCVKHGLFLTCRVQHRHSPD